MVVARTSPDRPSAAIIRGSAINQDGRSSGLTAPNGPSQTALMREALAGAMLPEGAGNIGYVAVHGTGAWFKPTVSLAGVLNGSFDHTRTTLIVQGTENCMLAVSYY